MKITVRKSTLLKIIRFLKWTKIAAKLAAIGTTVSGAVAAVSGYATSGVALSAAGATTYAASKDMSHSSYEKTKHIPPGRVNKQANMLRLKEIEQLRKSKAPNAPMIKTAHGTMLSPKSPGARPRSSAGMFSSALAVRKK